MNYMVLMLYSIWVDNSVKPYLEGDGTQTRDFCFVNNVVQANILAAENATPFKAEVFNVAQGESHSLNEVKELLERTTGRRLDLEQRDKRIGDVDHTLADVSAIKDRLGYAPAVDFEGQVAQMSHWYKHSYKKYN